MKKTIYLKYIKQLQEKINSDNNLIQVLLGPRQVGKTTTLLKLIEEFYPKNSHYVSADKIFNSDHSWLQEQWIFAARNEKILIVDEIQKVHNWAEVIKSLYDESKKQKKSIKCVLLGSSSLEIQKGLSESLTGRFQLTQAYHWNYSESNEGYKLKFSDYLKFGGYPGSYNFKDQNEWADYVKNSIIATVVEKDILQYNTVKNPALFRQAFEILTAYPAQEISYTKLLGQLQDKGNVEIIKYYIKLYEGAYLIKALEKYSEKKINIKSSSPKIVPLCPSLYYLNIQDDYKSDELGRVFELAVGAQLVRTGFDLYYWRDKNNEVDYVVKKGRRIWAIEVKSGRKKSNNGLFEFKNQFKNVTCVYITQENYFEFENDPAWFLEGL